MDYRNAADDEIREEDIEIQLELLNSTSAEINLWENEINERRKLYRWTLSETTNRLNFVARNLGDCISKSRPYYDAKKLAKEAQNNIQQAALDYDRVASSHTAAREMVYVAENGLRTNPCNAVWVEVLNRANEKVNETEEEKFKRGVEHRNRAIDLKQAEDRVKWLKASLKHHIKKSRPYFELKKVTQERLEYITQSVEDAAAKIHELKKVYSKTLQKLENISNSLHAQKKAELEEKQRKLLGQRQQGVGAESLPSENSQQSDLNDSTYQFVLEDLKKFDSLEDYDIDTTTSSSDVSVASGKSSSPIARSMANTSSELENSNASSFPNTDVTSFKTRTESSKDISITSVQGVESQKKIRADKIKQRNMLKKEERRLSRISSEVSSSSESDV